MKEKHSEQKVQVRFPVDVWQDTKQFAQEDERSFNGEIIWILRDYAAKRKGEKQKDEHEKL
jgi:hypothetical protein